MKRTERGGRGLVWLGLVFAFSVWGKRVRETAWRQPQGLFGVRRRQNRECRAQSKLNLETVKDSKAGDSLVLVWTVDVANVPTRGTQGKPGLVRGRALRRTKVDTAAARHLTGDSKLPG